MIASVNRKAIRAVAYPAAALFAFEAIPPALKAYNECAGDARVIVCSQNEDPWAIEPPHYHTLHLDYETNVRTGYQFLASGISSPTSTGPMYRMTLAGESVAR